MLLGGRALDLNAQGPVFNPQEEKEKKKGKKECWPEVVRLNRNVNSPENSLQWNITYLLGIEWMGERAPKRYGLP